MHAVIADLTVIGLNIMPLFLKKKSQIINTIMHFK